MYSEPFMGADDMVRNAVLAYSDKLQCRSQLDYLDSLHCDLHATCMEVSLIDLQGHCDNIAMPLTVVLNSYCDIDTRVENREVYFYEGRLKADDEFIFNKKRA